MLQKQLKDQFKTFFFFFCMIQNIHCELSHHNYLFHILLSPVRIYRILNRKYYYIPIATIFHVRQSCFVSVTLTYGNCRSNLAPVITTVKMTHCILFFFFHYQNFSAYFTDTDQNFLGFWQHNVSKPACWLTLLISVHQ